MLIDQIKWLQSIIRLENNSTPTMSNKHNKEKILKNKSTFVLTLKEKKKRSDSVLLQYIVQYIVQLVQ